MKWFTFVQQRDVRPYSPSFRVSERAGHFVVVQAETREKANLRFSEVTGLLFLEHDYDECSWKPTYGEGTAEPEIFGHKFIGDPNALLASIGRHYYFPGERSVQINVYYDDGNKEVFKYNEEDFKEADRVWRKGQPKLWAVMINSNHVSSVRRVIQTDFDANCYYDKAGNFGGDMVPEKEATKKGWGFAYFSSNSRKKAEAYRTGALRIFEAAVAGAAAELEKVKKTDSVERMGAKRAFILIKNLI